MAHLPLNLGKWPIDYFPEEAQTDFPKFLLKWSSQLKTLDSILVPPTHKEPSPPPPSDKEDESDNEKSQVEEFGAEDFLNNDE